LPLKNGRWRNVFLGQLVAYSLNLRLDPNLSSLQLCATMTTSGGTILIAQPVLNALSTLGLPQTAGGLLELANRVIAGEPVASALVNVNQVASALGSINEGFDECQALIGCSSNTPGSASKVMKSEASVPTEFGLEANYPNPFNPTTQISFGLPEASNVRLVVYNMIGQEVTTLAEGELEAGYHLVTWNANNNHGMALPSGIYLYRFEATSLSSGREFKEVRKMVLMK
jgi:hypothetical protein